MKKRKIKKSNKNTSTNSKMGKANELDPINSLFLAIKKNKLKLIGLFLNIFSAVFFAIKITTLHLWGIKSEFVFTMVSTSFLEYLPEIISLIFVILFTVCLEIITRKNFNKLVKIIIYFILFFATEKCNKGGADKILDLI